MKTFVNLRNPELLAALFISATLVACSDGVSLSLSGIDNVSNDDVSSPIASVSSVNDPANTLTEPFARDWTGAGRRADDVDPSGRCGLLAQDAGDAFATAAFERASSTQGDPFFRASRPAARNTPEYVEFCVATDQPGVYRIFAETQAPSLFEDSFFVTINEDEAGQEAEPGIFDLAATTLNSFTTRPVKTRTTNPILLDLDVGFQIVRFYYREPNAGIKSVSFALQPGNDDPPPPEPTTELAQCAANTGLSEEAIELLLVEYLGDTPRNFVLEPDEINTGQTERDDWKWNVNGERGTVMCLSDPGILRTNLVDNSISAGRIVIGSSGVDEQFEPTSLSGTFIGNGGADRVAIVRGGTFVGGDGDDRVGVVESGTVLGGPGADSVESMLDGTFSGADGNDSLRAMTDGRFDGGSGDDRIEQQLGGFFDGGPGPDSVTEQAEAAQSINVETIGGVFARFAAPEDLVVVEASDDRVLLRWSPSTDERTQGYEVRIFSGSTLSPEDLGVQVGREPQLFTTTRNFAVISAFRQSDAYTVRAFTQQADGSYLYSPSTLIRFTLPDVQELLATQTVLETARDNNAFNDATRTSDGTILIAVEDAAKNSRGSQLFTRYNAFLGVPVGAFADGLEAPARLAPAYGTNRQYMSYRATVTQTTSEKALLAFDDDARNLLWTVNDDDAFCSIPFVTRDDWFICPNIDLGSGVISAFIASPDGDVQRQVLSGVDFFTFLIDGDDGEVVFLDDDASEPLEAMSVLNLTSGEIVERPLDFSEQLESGQRAVAQGIAVRDKTAFVSGGVYDDVCRAKLGCFREPRFAEAIAYFMARIDIDTGAILDYRPYTVEQRPSDGVGHFTGDSVVFSASQPLTRHNIETLESVERVFLPGVVADINESSTLVVVKDRRTDGFFRIADLYLLAR